MNKPVITIMADYGGAYAWRKNEHSSAPGVGGNIACTSGWGFELPISDSLHLAFVQWQQRFEVLRSDTEINDFDWPTYHQEGIKLCRQLKRELGDAVIILYEKAFEDPCHRDAERREILADGTTRTCRIDPPTLQHGNDQLSGD